MSESGRHDEAQSANGEIGREGRAGTAVQSGERPAPPAAARADLAPDPAAPVRRPVRPLVLLLLTLTLAALAAALYLRYALSPPSATPAPIEFEVLPGWGATRVANELEQRGLVRDARLFTLWLRYRELDRSVGEGLYDLSPHQSANEIADALAAGGRPRTLRLVIPEGFRARDIAERVDEAGLDSAERFLAVVREPRDLRPPYLPAASGLEGYLFPASYDIPLAMDAEQIAALMVERFRTELDGDAIEALLVREITVHDWVTLASMVQAEAAGPSEMPIIAGVFLNRLDLGMRLQSDPTVAYGLDKDLTELSVFAGDFDSDHPWNTYTRSGLPFGPIGNPGRAALEAVLLPQRLDEEGEMYLYFLHGFDGGEPVFRPNITLQDHNRDIDRYLR